MAIPRKGRNNITIDGEKYFFRDSICRGAKPDFQTLTVVSTKANNQRFILEYPHLNTYRFLKEGVIIESTRYGTFAILSRKIIVYAVRFVIETQLWNPRNPGKDLYCHVSQDHNICEIHQGRLQLVS